VNISQTFIERPIATSLLMAAIALFGVVGYRALPVADLPNVDFPTLTVSASLPGANPDTMASAVATPLERQFTGIAGVDSITSNNSQGSSSITLQFDLSRDVDGAAVDVQTAIAQALPLLPPGMPNPPSFRKVNPADMPIMFLAITSSTLPLWVVDDYAQTVVAQRISMINGVAQVSVFGSQRYSVHVQVDPSKLAARRIGINEIAATVQSWNVNEPTGTLYGPDRTYNIQATGQLMNAEQYRPMVIAYRDGRPVRLYEVANVIDSVEDDKSGTRLYGGPFTGGKGINLMVMRQPGSNVIEVTDRIKELLPTFQAQLPPAMSLSIRGDRSKTIRESYRDVKVTMGITLVLVIGVIFIFLRNGSATLIPAMALPFSIVGTFSVMYLCDYSLDNLSMMALILSIGFVVDDAIVMLENAVRHIEKGATPMQAALTGSREIGFTIVSMTISLAAVFIPILFMSGILGRLFREFAVTITVAVLISGMVSISLTPMLCSRFLKPVTHDGAEKNLIYRILEWFFDGLNHIYRTTLWWVLRHRPVMLGVFAVVLGATAYLYVLVPKGFIPEQDNDQIYVNTEATQGTSPYQMARYQERLATILKQDPDVDTFMSSTGGMFGSGGGNTGRLFVQLKPRSERKLNSTQVAERLRPKLGVIPGVRAMVTVPASIRIGGRGSRSTYEFTLQATDTDNLYREAQKFERLMGRVEGLQDVNSDLQLKNPRINLSIDRDKAATLGLNVMQIENAFYDAFGSRWVSTIYGRNAQNRVLLELLPEYQSYADAISLLYFKSSNNTLVPVDAIVKRYYDAGPMTIAHSGQLPSVTISFNTRPGVALGDAVEKVEALARANLPGSITTSFSGTAKVFQQSLKNLGLLLTIAVLVVYIVLGVLYESFIHPLTILSGLPSAGLGALLTLLVFKVELTIYAFVGLILLIGIVKKNAIMQIDFALEAERKEGKGPREAIFEGCLIRFRPIMMTTAAALLGALPIALGWGAGGEARRPLGLTVVGGLLFSQLITLYLTPVVYTYNASIFEWLRGLRKPDRALQPAVQGGD
jgi:HAE1 family hydrophobic/amphiphilic exporter-1